MSKLFTKKMGKQRMTSSISGPVSLHWVVKHSDWTVEEIKEHLEAGFYCVDELDPKGRTPLLSLVGRSRCKASLVKVLLECKANVQCVDRHGRTPLLVALENDKCSLDVLKVLLRYGADPNHRCLLGYCALATALHHSRRTEIIELLHSHKAKFDSSHLCIALRRKASIGVIRLLLRFGCAPNDCKRHGSAVHCMTSSPIPGLREDILRELINAGADVCCPNAVGQQLMCFALQNGASLDMVRFMLNSRVPDLCDRHTTPLLCATVPFGHNVVCNTNLESLRKTTAGLRKMPLNTEIVRYFLKRFHPYPLGEINNEPRNWGIMESFLSALIYCDYEAEAMELLLNRAFLQTPTTQMLEFKRIVNMNIIECKPPLSVVKLLLERGYIDESWTPLLSRALSVEGCHLEMVNFLLEKGGSVNQKNYKGQTPLEVAIRFKQSAGILRILLEAGSMIGRERSSQPHHLYLAFQEYGCRDLNMNTTDPQRVLETEECLKALFTFAFLEFPDFNMCNLYKKLSGNDIDYLVSRGRMSKFLAEFPKICMAEVQNMLRLNVGDVNDTLFDIVAEKERYIRSHELDRCLEILLNKSFPIYHDFISSKMVRKLLIEKFREVPVYTAIIRNNSEQKFFLNYDCLLGILESPKLSTKDILSFVLAYYHLFPR